MFCPNGHPQLEDAVRLRGDLSISGKALDTLQAWSESYGYIPRSYEDTEADDFWKVCNDISEEFYIDAFSRTCFIGDDQETDPEDGDEELVPDVEMPLHEDDAGGAITPGERERLILEQYPFPGTPATEAERRAAWRMLPQRVRVAIRRLHRAFGQVLKQARASK